MKKIFLIKGTHWKNAPSTYAAFTERGAEGAAIGLVQSFNSTLDEPVTFAAEISPQAWPSALARVQRQRIAEAYSEGLILSGCKIVIEQVDIVDSEARAGPERVSVLRGEIREVAESEIHKYFNDHSDPQEALAGVIAMEQHGSYDKHPTLYAACYEGALAALEVTATPACKETLQVGSMERVEVPPMPETDQREPLDYEYPDSYLESDKDWSSRNWEAIRWLADNHDAIRAALSAMPEQFAENAKNSDGMREENARLSELVHVPGVWRCAKCDFTLIQSNLNAADGSITARDNPGDKCPNDGAPLWRVSYRDWALENEKGWTAHLERKDAENARLRGFVERVRDASCSWSNLARAALSHGEKG